MTDFDTMVARLKGDIDFLMLEPKEQREDAAAMLRLFGLDDDPLSVAEVIEAVLGEAVEAKKPAYERIPVKMGSIYNLEDIDPHAPVYRKTPDGLLARFKDIVTWQDQDLAELLGKARPTIQAYVSGRLAENFDKAKLAALIDAMTGQLADLRKDLIPS